jgi:hypothetical protein
MTLAEAEQTVAYLANQLRIAHDTAARQHQIVMTQSEQLKKADAQIERLKQEAAAAQQ